MTIFWPDKPARAIARLFRDDPDGWKGGPHYATHKASGLRVWIASAAFHLEVESAELGKLYGFFFPWGNASQLWIWWAYRRWRDGRFQLAALSRATGETK